MEVIKALIPGMIFIGLVIFGVLIWAVRRGQYEDLEGDANRILLDEDEPDQAEKKRKVRRENWPDAE